MTQVSVNMPIRRGIERPPPAEDVYASAERRRAARALLRHPMLLDDGPTAEDLARVRRHRDALSALFADGLGYRLEVETHTARLFKAGLGRDILRPLLRRNGRPFSPRAYALMCLTVAALSRCRDQLLIDELVAEVRSAAADAGLDIDLDSSSDRRALHAALGALQTYGVLRERDGDLSAWADDPRAQSLLDVSRERLRLLVSAGLPAAEFPADLLDTAAVPSAAGGARVAVRRCLLESPVLTVAELPDDQAEWWRRNRGRERDWFLERFGLDLELRAEGAAAFDLADELSDVDFPGQGSHKHYALLLLERLVAAGRGNALSAGAADRAWCEVGRRARDAARTEVLAAFSKGFKKEHRENPDLLHREARDLLVQVGLLRLEDGDAGEDCRWFLHACAARYAARATLPSEPSLFDDVEPA